MPYVPNRFSAVVPIEKVENYLLSTDHPEGVFKANFFMSKGFTLAEDLCGELIRHVEKNTWETMIPTPFGVKYVVEGTIETPFGINVEIRTVWIVRAEEEFPRLITAYPV